MSRQLVDMGSGEVVRPPAVIEPGQREAQQAVAEIQAALVVAARTGRNKDVAIGEIMAECKRLKLAEQATYAYPRGGKEVTGPSIRLAEVLAQNWGFVDFGIRIVAAGETESMVETYAWDMVTGSRARRTFPVKHSRKARGEIVDLDDPRDVYELTANMGARRLRACILQIIPGYVVDAALEQCEETIKKGNGEPLIDRVRKMVSLFADIGVSQEMIEKRLGHNISATIEAEVVSLRGVYKSIKDGFAGREAYFDLPGAPKAADETPAEPTPLDKPEPEPEPVDTFETEAEKAERRKKEEAEAIKGVQSVFSGAALQHPGRKGR